MRRSINATGWMLTVFLGGCASSQPPQPASAAPAAVPSDLQPQNANLLMKLHAEGSQIYVCKASAAKEGGGYRWALKAPDAKLYDDNGRLAATHFAGPTWKSTTDGSVVVGEKVKSVPAPVPGAIPWLLLKAASTAGSGQFSSVVAIQRVATAGGTPPAEDCAPSNLGAERATSYKAEYYFFGASTAKASTPATASTGW